MCSSSFLTLSAGLGGETEGGGGRHLGLACREERRRPGFPFPRLLIPIGYASRGRALLTVGTCLNDTRGESATGAAHAFIMTTFAGKGLAYKNSRLVSPLRSGLQPTPPVQPAHGPRVPPPRRRLHRGDLAAQGRGRARE